MRYNIHMPRITRRALLAGSAMAAAAPLPAAPQAQPKRNLLGSSWTPEAVAAALAPRERFHPIPTAAERPGWSAVPPDAAAALVQAGEHQLKTPWEVLPATLALEFKRNGNRSRYEAVRERRRRKLQDLVMAECIEAKGRFMGEIANGIWLISEETFWGVPAHLGAQKAGVGLPDVSEPIVELFAGETAGLLAWSLYLLEPQLRAVSPLVPERIRIEIDRRILTPCLVRDDFGWMGFRGQSLNNWTPWISSNWLTAALLVERDEKRRAAAVHRVVRCLDNFLNGYHDDGGCDEGPGYWGRAGASLFDCLDLLHSASGGKLDGFPHPLIREIGLYICRAHIYDEWYTNFADAPARVYANGDLIYRFGARVGDDIMKKHGAFAAFLRNESGMPGDSIGRQLPALFNLAALRKAPRMQALLRDVWLPGIQVMAARGAEGSPRGLYLAAQGGHNGESHNHNDVGNFIVFADGKPAIIDVGVEAYTAKTFSSKRYEIWTMQSAYHNCPTIDGVMQAAGRQFAASEVSHHADDASAEFRLNIEKAYPKEANLASWKRTLRLTREKNQIELIDDYALKGATKTITLTLMTPCRVTEAAPGQLLLAGGPRVLYDQAAFRPVVEEIVLEDQHLRGTWGERLYRILLRADNPPQRAVWTTRIVQSA
jgi:hypothetical protein